MLCVLLVRRKSMSPWLESCVGVPGLECPSLASLSLKPSLRGFSADLDLLRLALLGGVLLRYLPRWGCLGLRDRERPLEGDGVRERRRSKRRGGDLLRQARGRSRFSRSSLCCSRSRDLERFERSHERDRDRFREDERWRERKRGFSSFSYQNSAQITKQKQQNNSPRCRSFGFLCRASIRALCEPCSSR